MANVKWTRGASSGVNAEPLLDGQILFDRETKRIFLDAVVDDTLTRIAMKEGTFTGTTAEWSALSDAQKALFTFVNITDDYELHSDVMEGATASTDGQAGLVPQPHAGDQDKVLKGNGTWGSVASSLEGLTDVNLSFQSDGQALVWDDTNDKWVNGDVTIPVDSELSTTSENPVQNKVIKGALDDKADTSSLGSAAAVNVTNAATQNSTDAFTSGGAYTAMKTAQTNGKTVINIAKSHQGE